jgi:acyl carrier protein
MRPKLEGAWLLHALLQDAPLDFFVLFSSASSVLRSPFIGGYAAANAFLDALAAQRRAEGRPATAISWGVWGDLGMAARHQHETGQDVTPRGMTPIAPEQGVEIMVDLLAAPAAHVAVIPMDWSHLAQCSYPLLANLVPNSDPPADQPPSTSTRPQPVNAEQRRPVQPIPAAKQLSRVSKPVFAAQSKATTAKVAPAKAAQRKVTQPAVTPARQGKAATSAPRPAENGNSHSSAGQQANGNGARPVAGLVQSLLSADAGQRRQLLDDYLVAQTARVLQLAPAEVDAGQPLNRLGIDSLMAVELRNRIESDFGIRVELVTFLEGASLTDLTNRLLAELPQGTNRVAEAMAQLDKLTDEDVEKLLAEKRLIGS